MRYTILLAVFAVGCSGGASSPTSPTVMNPVATTPAVTPVAPPVVATPAPAPTPNPILSDARFSLTFYRQFALGSLDNADPRPLRRHSQAPRIYLRTVDDGGTPIDAGSLDAIASALENTAGSLTGRFGVQGIDRGTDTRQGVAGWITVRWSNVANPNACGQATVGGDLITLFPRTSGCRCGGGPAVSLSTIKHELGHALGYWHTDNTADLMYPTFNACDKNPSAREVFHAQVAYSMPVGSRDPS